MLVAHIRAVGRCPSVPEGAVARVARRSCQGLKALSMFAWTGMACSESYGLTTGDYIGISQIARSEAPHSGGGTDDQLRADLLRRARRTLLGINQPRRAAANCQLAARLTL